MMKKIIYYSFLIFALTACQKEDPLTENTDATPNFSGGTIGNPGGGNNDDGTLSANIDGTPYTASTIASMQMGGMIIFSTMDASMSNNIAITLEENITTGVYDFGAFPPIGNYTYLDSNITYESDGPALEILSHDTAKKTIRGNFFFTGYNPDNMDDSVLVTNGTFDFNYK